MDRLERLEAIEAIRPTEAKHFRGVDSKDAELVRGVLAKDCVLDYRGGCTDPDSGRDHLPAMNVVLRGVAAWSAGGLAALGIVSVHQSHDAEIDVAGEDEARAIFSMTDRLWAPPGGPFALMTGYGHYHETYRRQDGGWKIAALRITRLRVEAS